MCVSISKKKKEASGCKAHSNSNSYKLWAGMGLQVLISFFICLLFLIRGYITFTEPPPPREGRRRKEGREGRSGEGGKEGLREGGTEGREGNIERSIQH